MYRILKGLTQADLAARVGMSVIAISNIETGKCKPSIRHWLRICKVLEIPYEMILDEEDAAHPANWYAVRAPMVGTFYAAPAPGEPPFVQVGDEVAARQTLCIVEAMKLMNEIEAEEMGTVREVCLEDATPVEYGTVLFWIEPITSGGSDVQ